MQVGPQELGDKVAVYFVGLCDDDGALNGATHMSSRGDMKMSLKLMTWRGSTPDHVR